MPANNTNNSFLTLTNVQSMSQMSLMDLLKGESLPEITPCPGLVLSLFRSPDTVLPSQQPPLEYLCKRCHHWE